VFTFPKSNQIEDFRVFNLERSSTAARGQYNASLRTKFVREDRARVCILGLYLAARSILNHCIVSKLMDDVLRASEDSFPFVIDDCDGC